MFPEGLYSRLIGLHNENGKLLEGPIGSFSYTAALVNIRKSREASPWEEGELYIIPLVDDHIATTSHSSAAEGEEIADCFGFDGNKSVSGFYKCMRGKCYACHYRHQDVSIELVSPEIEGVDTSSTTDWWERKVLREWQQKYLKRLDELRQDIERALSVYLKAPWFDRGQPNHSAPPVSQGRSVGDCTFNIPLEPTAAGTSTSVQTGNPTSTTSSTTSSNPLSASGHSTTNQRAPYVFGFGNGGLSG
jgi:hypothetical protein